MTPVYNYISPGSLLSGQNPLSVDLPRVGPWFTDGLVQEVRPEPMVNDPVPVEEPVPHDGQSVFADRPVADHESQFGFNNPIIFAALGAGGLYALYRVYGASKSKPSTAVVPEIKTQEDAVEIQNYPEHFAALKRLEEQMNHVVELGRVEVFKEICAQIARQMPVYESDATQLTDLIDLEKAQTNPDHAKLLRLMKQRAVIYKAFQRDVALLDALMEHWHIRQQPEFHDFLKIVENRYFTLENSGPKAVPIYGVNFMNSVLSIVGALVMLSVFNEALPYLFHDAFPSAISLVENPHEHWNAEAVAKFLKLISLFGISFDAIYGGYKGMRSRNANNILSRGWNSVLDFGGNIYGKVVDPIVRSVNQVAQPVLGKPWEVATRYMYRGTSLGAMGMVRQIGRDVTLTPNEIATAPMKAFKKDVNTIRFFGNVGDVSLGVLVGGIFDWSVGVTENVVQNIILKMPGDSLTARVGVAMQDPFGLVWHNAAPSAACNALHGNATARVTQFEENDDMHVVYSRFGLGVTKGSLLAALIATPAINGDYEGAVGIYLGAQLIIGGNSILLSKVMTDLRLPGAKRSIRQSLGDGIHHLRTRFS